MKGTNVIKDIVVPFFVSLSVEITMIFIQSKMNNINVFNIILYIIILFVLIGFIIYRVKSKQQIVKVYEKYNDSKQDIIKDCKKSSKIILFGISG